MLYLEHRFVLCKTETLAAISMSRVCFGRHTIDKVLEKYPGGDEKPQYPERLRQWIEALSQSSKEMIVD